MNRALFPLAALALCLAVAPAHAAGVTPPATKWLSSLTEPTPVTGSDFHITKSSQAQVSVSSGTITFKLKLTGVVDGGVPVNQAGNNFQVDVRYGGLLHTLSFTFDLINGKTDARQTKFAQAISGLPGGAVVPDDSIEVRTVRCIQGGTGPGVGLNFCTPGLTAK